MINEYVYVMFKAFSPFIVQFTPLPLNWWVSFKMFHLFRSLMFVGQVSVAGYSVNSERCQSGCNGPAINDPSPSPFLSFLLSIASSHFLPPFIHIVACATKEIIYMAHEIFPLHYDNIPQRYSLKIYADAVASGSLKTTNLLLVKSIIRSVKVPKPESFLPQFPHGLEPKTHTASVPFQLFASPISLYLHYQ